MQSYLKQTKKDLYISLKQVQGDRTRLAGQIFSMQSFRDPGPIC